MKQKYLLSILMSASFLLITSLGSLYAQGRTVSGKVVDGEDNSAMPGVNVIVKGTSEGTVTDFDGNYSLNVPENTTLVFSFVGYQTEEIEVGNRSVIDVTLMPDIQALQEIVVIGYGEVKKEDATGAVTSVSTEDFNKGAIATPQELIMGKAPGVVITTQGGAAGTGSTIRIRGGSSLRASNDPLFVVDGIPLESSGISGMANPLSTINPNDIETFTVLKDASATAIYGSRASNGVIIITTKQGSKGKMTLSYNGNVSVGVPANYMDVHNGDEYRTLIQDRVDNHGLTNQALDLLGEADTDWQKEIYQNAISTDHNVSLSGAVKDIPYRVSLGYTNQNGILKYNNMERTSFNVNVTPSLFNDDLRININAKGSFIGNNFSNPDAIGAAVQFDPTQPVSNGNTRYGGYTAWTELTSGDPINGVPNNIVTKYKRNYLSVGKR
jgi:TonB-linked SusC/RagA family outer membrane protein